MHLWDIQEKIRRDLDEELELHGGRSVRELVKEVNQRVSTSRKRNPEHSGK